MPQLGEIKRGYELGRGERDWRFGTYGLAKYIWSACEKCGLGRWVRDRKPFRRFCQRCGSLEAVRLFGDKHHSWRGGRTKSAYGYIWIYIPSNSFFISMAKMVSKHGGYVAEHRLVMAEHLGRCLQFWERVHHKNGIKDDNHYENLELTDLGDHITDHSKGYRDGYGKGFTDGRSGKIRQLEARIEELENTKIRNT